MRGELRATALSLLLCVAPSFCLAAEITVISAPVSTFKGKQVGEVVDSLIWRGGIAMSSESGFFGGLSGITFTGPGNQAVMVTDVGNFVSGRLLYDEAGRPFQFAGVAVEPIRNSKGEELPRAFARDAEAIDTIYRNGVPAAVRVGFENLTRVADFELAGGNPGGPAREIAIPHWLADLRTNASMESLCIAPPASPVAGSTLLIIEAPRGSENLHDAYLIGNRDKGELRYVGSPGLRPTDCAFLPNGDLLVLERGTSLLSFTMALRRIPASDVRPDATMDGQVILTASGGDIDNMEGLAVHEGPAGETRITIISDDNFNDWERTLLLEFSLN